MTKKQYGDAQIQRLHENSDAIDRQIRPLQEKADILKAQIAELQSLKNANKRKEDEILDTRKKRELAKQFKDKGDSPRIQIRNHAELKAMTEFAESKPLEFVQLCLAQYKLSKKFNEQGRPGYYEKDAVVQNANRGYDCYFVDCGGVIRIKSDYPDYGEYGRPSYELQIELSLENKKIKIEHDYNDTQKFKQMRDAYHLIGNYYQVAPWTR